MCVELRTLEQHSTHYGRVLAIGLEMPDEYTVCRCGAKFTNDNEGLVRIASLNIFLLLFIEIPASVDFLYGQSAPDFSST